MKESRKRLEIRDMSLIDTALDSYISTCNAEYREAVKCGAHSSAAHWESRIRETRILADRLSAANFIETLTLIMDGE